jgi:hypothetical protein
MSRGRQFNRGHWSLAAELSLWFSETWRYARTLTRNTVRADAFPKNFDSAWS